MDKIYKSPPRKIGGILLATILSLCSYVATATSAAPESELRELLRELDRTLDNSAVYVEARQSRIDLLAAMAAEKYVRPEQRYQINLSLYDEYSAFSFDKSMACLYANLDLAAEAGSREKRDETNIMLAALYTNAGMYLEASEIFNRDIDPAKLAPSLKTDYYLARQLLAYELSRYSKQEQVVEEALKQYENYSAILFAEPNGMSFEQNCRLGIYLMHKYRFDEAEHIFKQLLSENQPSSRNYAIAAYRLGEICDQTERKEEMLCWYARSAIADVQSATKDNAALCSLANQLFGYHDIARAFRYIRVSMDDAIFYNAKLRPWQVAASMPHIEQAAQESERMRTRQLNNFTIIVSALLFFLLTACVYLWRSYRQTRRNQKILSERNRQIDSYNRELSELNKVIGEANRVKEEYIGLFLSICSNYIDRLIDYQRNVRRKLTSGKVAELQKETSSSSLIEEETRKFYEIFDTAFLQLYPTFVEDFNSLLADDEHIELHKGDLLNTELRIFALIRLGITDSSKIASLLRYSVNTIYNYRAKVKNKAKFRRDDFEEAVRHIDSFKTAE